MEAADVARQFARQRPGYDLVSYREVALPVFKCEVSATVSEVKPVAPIQEFVLRAIGLGVTVHAEIAGLLGIDEPMAREAVVQLMHDDEVVLVDGSRSGHRLALTAKGRRTAKDLTQSVISEIDMPIFIDGLTRKVVTVFGAKRLGIFRANDASQRGLPLVSAQPRRPPRLSEITDADVSAAMLQETAGRQARRQILGISELRRTSRHARPGTALAFRSEDSGEVQISIVVDGAFSESHDEAFSRSLKLSSNAVFDDTWETFESVIETAVGKDVVAQAAPTSLTEQIVDQRQNVLEEQRDLRQAIDDAKDVEIAELRQQLDEAGSRERALAAKFEGLSVRHVPVHDHPEYLRRAFQESKHRVLVVSPWISARVVDASLLKLIEDAASRGVKVLIGYGIPPQKGEAPAKREDQEAVRKLENLARQYRSMHVLKFGDTHAKVLVSDSSWAIVTSFNWLSFRGASKLYFRDERGMYIGLKEKVDELFGEYSVRFQR